MLTRFFRNTLLGWLAVAFGAPVLLAQNNNGSGQKRVNTSGKVIDSVTGRPIPNLHLHMTCPSRGALGGSYDTVADEHGAFTFLGVPEDACATSIAGHAISPKYTVHFNGTEKQEPWIIQLIPPVVITGTVLNEKGAPVVWAPIHIARSLLDPTMGKRKLEWVGPVSTDSQGRFRIEIPQESQGLDVKYDLYRLCTEFSTRELRSVYPLTCVPGVVGTMQAGWIELHPGQSRDFTFRLMPVPAGTISGTFKSPQALSRIYAMTLDRSDFPLFSASAIEATLNPENSTFDISGLLPGKYRVRAVSEPPGDSVKAVVDVEVRPGEVTNVQLLLVADRSLRGRIRTEDGSPPPKGSYSLDWANVYGGYSPGPLNIADDGSFKTPAPEMGFYQFSISVPEPWHVTSATSGTYDLLAGDVRMDVGATLTPLDVVLSRSVGTIEATTAKEDACLGWIFILRRIGSRVAMGALPKQDSERMTAAPNFTWKDISPGTYWILYVSTREVPFMEMDFLQKHMDYIQEIEVRKDSASRVQLKRLDLR